MSVLSQISETPIAERKLDIGNFVFYPNFSIAEITEGTHVTFEKISNLLQTAEDIYGSDTPFVYISNRVNSYSIDPLGYYKAIKLFPNLKGYAIVTQNTRRGTLMILEKRFIKKPIRLFNNLEEASQWAQELLEKST